MAPYKKIISIVLVLSCLHLYSMGGQNFGREAGKALGDSVKVLGGSVEVSSALLASSLDRNVRQLGTELRETGPVLIRPLSDAITTAGNAVQQSAHAAGEVVTTTGVSLEKVLAETGYEVRETLKTTGTELRATATTLGTEIRFFSDTISGAPQSVMPHFKNIPIWGICTASAVIGLLLTKKGIELIVDSSTAEEKNRKKEQRKGVIYNMLGYAIVVASVVAIMHSEYIITSYKPAVS